LLKVFYISFLCLIGSISIEEQELDVFEAARTGNDIVLLRLMSLNADTANSVNAQGYSPLILATYYSQYKAMNLLIEHGANVNYLSIQGTALCGAAYKGDTAAVEILLRHDADPNIADHNGTTPLLYATLFSHNAIARLLFISGAKPDIADNEGLTAENCANQLKNKELIELFKNYHK
jgi:ankyrin repeat protein